VLADYAIMQPFAQLSREVFTPRPEEFDAYSGITVPVHRVLALEKRGWHRTAPQEGGMQDSIERPVRDGLTVVLGLDPGIAIGSTQMFPDQRVERVGITESPGGWYWSRPVGKTTGMHPVTASELMRDLRTLTD